MPLKEHELREVVTRLVSRPGHENVKVSVYELLVHGLDAARSEVDFERAVPEVRGRIDALLGRTVFEFKSDLRREGRDAEEQLARYLSDREAATGQRFIGIATDGRHFPTVRAAERPLAGAAQVRPIRREARGIIALAPLRRRCQHRSYALPGGSAGRAGPGKPRLASGAGGLGGGVAGIGGPPRGAIEAAIMGAVDGTGLRRAVRRGTSGPPQSVRGRRTLFPAYLPVGSSQDNGSPCPWHQPAGAGGPAGWTGPFKRLASVEWWSPTFSIGHCTPTMDTS